MNNPTTKETARRWGVGFIRWAFAVALALLFVLVLRSIAVQITPPPKLATEPYPDTSTQELCEQAGGRWVERQGGGVTPVPTKEGVVQPYCQGPLAFEREREAQTQDSQQTSLFVFAIGGAIAVGLALLVKALHPVAPGLMLGGIVSFLFAGVQIWILSPGIGRLITVAVIFVILVGIGLYTFREKTT